METSYKLEGDVLKISVKQSVQVDQDQDGVAAISGSITAEISADGSEILQELFKSTSLVEKAKELLGKFGHL